MSNDLIITADERYGVIVNPMGGDPDRIHMRGVTGETAHHDPVILDRDAAVALAARLVELAAPEAGSQMAREADRLAKAFAFCEDNEAKGMEPAPIWTVIRSLRAVAGVTS